MKHLNKIFLAAALLGSFFPRISFAQELDSMWSDVLREVRWPSDNGVAEMSVDEMVAEIVRIRGEAMAAALKKGRNNLLGENVRGENGGLRANGLGRNGYVTLDRSATDDIRRNDKVKIVRTDSGESIAACRLGAVSAAAIDPTQYKIEGLERQTNATVYVQICAGEQFSEKEYCHVDIDWVAGRARSIPTREWRTKIIGITNKVAFGYVMKDPKDWEGCSTREGLIKRLGAAANIKTGTRAQELMIRGGALEQGRDIFDAEVLRKAKLANFAACTNPKNMQTVAIGHTILDLDDKFIQLVQTQFRGKDFKIAPEETEDDQDSDTRIAPENDLFGPKFQGLSGTKYRDQLVQRMPQLRRRVSSSRNTCGIGSGSRLGGIRPGEVNGRPMGEVPRGFIQMDGMPRGRNGS